MRSAGRDTLPPQHARGVGSDRHDGDRIWGSPAARFTHPEARVRVVTMLVNYRPQGIVGHHSLSGPCEFWALQLVGITRRAHYDASHLGPQCEQKEGGEDGACRGGAGRGQGAGPSVTRVWLLFILMHGMARVVSVEQSIPVLRPTGKGHPLWPMGS